MNFVITYFATLIPFIALDMAWLLVVAKKFYSEQIGFLMGESFNLTPVMFFYPLYACGIVIFAVLPALSSGSWVEALWRGALLGLVAYGAYDLTNHATIAGWPTSVTIVDMAWGTFATALASVLAYFIVSAFI